MTNVVQYEPPAAATPAGNLVLLPANLSEGMRFADMMSSSRLVPVHLQKSPADCMMVLMQAMRWRMDPFAVAQATAVIHGKLMYEGKLVAAVVNSLGQLTKRLGYEYSGSGDNRTVEVTGTLRGEPKPLSVTVRLGDAKTDNKVWKTQPDQQLAYHGARVWARRYMPELMLGVYSPEEFPAASARDVTPAPQQIEQQPQVPEKPKPAPKPIRVKVPGQPDATFPQNDGLAEALRAALDFMSGAILDGGAEIVTANAALLDRIAERLPDMAEAVADLRAAAAMADEAMLSDPDAIEAEDPDEFPGDASPGE
jgi:hypothetical protein